MRFCMARELVMNCNNIYTCLLSIWCMCIYNLIWCSRETKVSVILLEVLVRGSSFPEKRSRGKNQRHCSHPNKPAPGKKAIAYYSLQTYPYGILQTHLMMSLRSFLFCLHSNRARQLCKGNGEIWNGDFAWLWQKFCLTFDTSPTQHQNLILAERGEFCFRSLRQASTSLTSCTAINNHWCERSARQASVLYLTDVSFTKSCTISKCLKTQTCLGAVFDLQNQETCLSESIRLTPPASLITWSSVPFCLGVLCQVSGRWSSSFSSSDGRSVQLHYYATLELEFQSWKR